MKKACILFAAILAFSCAQELVVDEEPAVKGTVLKATVSDVKTAINGVKISWTEGDAICVNGAVSSPLTEAGESAEFSFGEILATPYKALYPSSLYKDETTIRLPAVWNSFNVPLYGYLAEGPIMTFHSLVSIIKLTVTSEDANTLSRVVFKTLGEEQVSGEFGIDYATGALTGTSASEANSSVEVKVGKALGSEAVTVYIPVPAGTYSTGYNVDLINSENKIMRCPVGARTLSAGELRIMPTLAFKPNVEEETGPGGIRNAEDFLEFASAVNAGQSTSKWENGEGWVTLLDDIDFTGITSWTPVGNATAPWTTSYNPTVTDGQAFIGKFDGNAHHIKNLALVDNVDESGRHFGLFGYVGSGGIVQNFIIDATCSLSVTSSVSHSAGLIAGVLYDATVRDVTSYAPMTYTGGATDYFHMALIGGIYAGTTGCVVDSVHNNGAIEAQNTANLNGSAAGLHIAGIVGFANAGEKTNVISSCNNYGDMTSQAGRTAGILGAVDKVENAVRVGI